MVTLAAHGIRANLPGGFEGRIARRVPAPGEQSFAVAHFATFPISSDTADFGGGAVNRMGASDVFAVLFEYGPESIGTKLFARRGMPRGLQERDFRPYVLRRGIPGQAGTQWFFQVSGRPFTFYAVLGSYSRRVQLVPRLNDLLAGLHVANPPAAVAPTLQWN